MAKKKSKTQKYKKSVKKKNQKLKKPNTPSKNQQKKQIAEKGQVKYNLPLTEPKKMKILQQKKKQEQKRKLADNDKVIYNAPYLNEVKKEKKLNFRPAVNKTKVFVKDSVINIKKGTKIIGTFLINTTKAAYKKINGLVKNKKKEIPKQELPKLKKEKVIDPKKSLLREKEIKRHLEEEKAKRRQNIIREQELKEIERELEEKFELDKEAIKKEEMKKKNSFIRFIYGVHSNMYIVFNAVLILFFIFLLIGINRIEVFKTSTIVYISAMIIFLMLVAISYNKYFSGKIFTIILCAGMGYAIYQMNYTYDFINNLNSNVYEYKTYYVVTFNNSQNKSIYNINNKKVGLLKDNSTNIERKLNTKLDKVNYTEYEDINELYSDFYSQKFRAIIVNENQYTYLKNNIYENARDVKIIYEFKANAKK